MADQIVGDTILLYIFCFLLGTFVASYIFYVKRHEMIYLMQLIETKLNTPKTDKSKLADEGWKCLKCNTYYEMKDQDNEQLAYLCHKDKTVIYHICKICGARWDTPSKKQECKHGK